MLQTKPMKGKPRGKAPAKFPPGHDINILPSLTFIEADDGYLAVLDIGHETGETLTFPAVALDSYAACRKELLKRYAARLVLWECENCRTARESREAWLELVDRALEGGRE